MGAEFAQVTELGSVRSQARQNGAGRVHTYSRKGSQLLPMASKRPDYDSAS